MPKITRKKLTRGTKLGRDAVFIGGPIASGATRLSTAAMDRDNLKQSYGTFRLNLNIPRINVNTWTNDFVGGALVGRTHLCIPFTLPPLQDEISAAGTLTEASTTYTLTEFGISIDQRAEPASIVDGDNWSYDAVQGNKLEVSLVEKRMLSYDADAPLYPEREVASFTLDGVSFAGRTLRLNPFLMTGMSKEIHPYRSYMVMLRAPDAVTAYAGGVASGTDFFSVNITLKFRTPLKARDTVAGVSVQNMPTVHNGAKTNATVTVTAPAANALITADAAGGMNRELSVVDAVLGSRLEGGYLADGDVAAVEHIATDSCYEIIAVPMWQNFDNKGVLMAENVAKAAWIDHTTTGQGPIVDWRRIPIDYPFVLHHVVAMANYAAPASITAAAGANHPTTTALFQVGVLMGTGIRGDLFQYEQLAYLSWQPSTHPTASTIDRLTNKADGLLGEHVSGAEHDYELISVPLVNTGGATAVGPRTMSAATLTSQGRPIFIGRGNTKTGARTNVGGSASDVLGNEQFIEVRWAVKGNGNTLSHPTGARKDEMYAGIGGNWVYLIGRKAIAADIAEIEPSAK